MPTKHKQTFKCGLYVFIPNVFHKHGRMTYVLASRVLLMSHMFYPCYMRQLNAWQERSLFNTAHAGCYCTDVHNIFFLHSNVIECLVTYVELTCNVR